MKLAREWHADALRPQSWFDNDGIAPSAIIDPSAHLEDGVIVDPLAVIGPRVEIGAGTVIGAGAVIGADVKIGRDCNVGARTAIQFALIGNNVLIHPGCSIGQDGYGFIFFGPEGHLKVPQTGRVLIQNDVEIGAGTTIDRGSLRDTVIGEGTKIDNQVQIGHNVTIGRHCLLAAQIGLAGSLTIGDNVALGAKVGINNHLKIGDGAQVTAMSAVKDDIPPNGRWGGFFAKADQAVVQGDCCSGTAGARWHGRSERRGAGVMEEAAVRFELVDINEILKTLPHRYPMLLIDRVIKIRTDYQRHRHQERHFQRAAVSRPFSRSSGLSRRDDDRGHGADRRRHRHQVGRGHREAARGLFPHHRQVQIPQTGDARRYHRVPHALDRPPQGDVVVSRRRQGEWQRWSRRPTSARC